MYLHACVRREATYFSEIFTDKHILLKSNVIANTAELEFFTS